MFTCLRCDTIFSSRKHLSVHTPLCADSLALSNVIYNHKRKAVRPSSRIRHGKMPQVEAHEPMPPPPDFPIAGPSNPSIHNDTVELTLDSVNDYQIDEVAMVSAIPLLVVSNQSGRCVCMPAQFQDYLPGSATHLAHMLLSAYQQCALHAPQPRPSTPPPSLKDWSEPPPPQSNPPAPVLFTTEPDNFGLYQTYAGKPTQIVQDMLQSAYDAPDFLDCPAVDTSARQALLSVSGCAEISPDEMLALFSNSMSGILMVWHYSGTNQKSTAKLDCLAHLQAHPHFIPQDLKMFFHAYESKRLDDFLESRNNPFRTEYG
ncbi:hypothetical protein J3R83DRAFT_7711 [Lanmaoa asiatica]|nr:hypothetical protein J3R83DRAFT_7711 [Lanmaoa asiatica]